MTDFMTWEVNYINYSPFMVATIVDLSPILKGKVTKSSTFVDDIIKLSLNVTH